MGTNSSTIPEEDVQNIKYNRLSQYQRLNQLIQSFWSRWKKEYLCELQGRKKWQQGNQRLLQENDLVILKEDNAPPASWKMARITAVHPGADGIVRTVTLKTSQGTFIRPATKVCLLPMDEDPEQPALPAPSPQ